LDDPGPLHFSPNDEIQADVGDVGNPHDLKKRDAVHGIVRLDGEDGGLKLISERKEPDVDMRGLSGRNYERGLRPVIAELA
jgi:hypothetical protein